MTPPAAPAVTIRLLEGMAELEQCVRLQHEVWGDDFGEAVARPTLWMIGRTGGIVAGAFAADSSMLGTLVGFAGWVDGRPIHWSDMLAVRPDARDLGLGRRLKAFQRETLLQRGVSDVYWTFDPLESRNARLNFGHLGVTCREYVRDCYGQSASHLHQGLSTDRFVVHWSLSGDRVRRRMEGEAPPGAEELAAVPLVNPGGSSAEGLLAVDAEAAAVRVRIPADIQAVKRRDAEEARAWRAVTRQAFEMYLAAGYEVVELARVSAEHSDYLLRRSG